ncbi:TonB-dependent receptor [Croceibacterium ferulae]|uniref:TonB-dependent receptor n=1 Tax=Croceibacterium ferulae TaxID=1854641 RepID=UPI000EB30476|nr:TonB-dependent receptor [Croceibacterium ferulae]
MTDALTLSGLGSFRALRGLLYAGCAVTLVTGGSAAAQDSTTAQPSVDPSQDDAAPGTLPPVHTAEEAVTGEAGSGDTIVVSGIRSSIESALAAKRQDVRVTDGISAEDIGKFPSENITEAIQRISGVQMSNVNGRGATIGIRGLGPQYANTTINGQNFLSADFTDGFRYDVVQTELASAIQVIKSPTANMDAGGLSGTVNINTVQPLEYRGDRFIVSVKGQKAELAEGGVTPKVSATYVDRFLDDRLGVFLSASYQELSDRADYMWMDRWFTTPTTAGDRHTPRRLRFRRIDRDTDRLLLNGTLQYQPTDTLELSLSGIYAQDKTDYDVNQQVFGFDSQYITVTQTDGLTDTGILADNVYTDNNRQVENRDLTSSAYTAKAEWENDGWHVDAVGHYTRGRGKTREDAAIFSVFMDGLALNYSDPDNVILTPTRPLTDATLYAPENWLFYTYPNGAERISTAQERAGQLDLTRDVDFAGISSIVVGGKYRHESFDRDVSRHDRDALETPPTSVFPRLEEYNYLVTDFLNGRMSVPDSWVAPSIAANDEALAANGGTPPDLFAPESSYEVDRFITSAYAMANIDTDIGDMGLRGNVGIRYEHSKQKIFGYITQDVPGAEVDQITGTYIQEKNYGNWLPSAALVLDIAPGALIRAAAAKVLVRPLLNTNSSLARMRSTFVDALGQTVNSIDLGQAELDPLTANQFDLGFEYYYAGGSAISIAGFWKDIKNGTFSRLICSDTYEGVALSYNGDGDCQGSNGELYDIVETLNDPTTITIKGLEIAWTQSLDQWLPVAGFGFTGNYTRVFPEKVEIGEGYRIRNLSEQTWNLTAYWEDDTFSVRASVNQRSSYEQDFSDSFFAREDHTVRKRTQVDLALGYALNDRINFAAGVINLNNAGEEAYKDFEDRWQMTSITGRSYYLTATARF